MPSQHRFTEEHRHGELRVIECEDCGFRHLWPLPTPGSLRDVYEREFGDNIRPQFRAKKKEDAAHWGRVFARRQGEYRRLMPHVKRPRVLDVGCGVGDFLSFFAERGSEVWGVEPSEHFHGDLRERGVNVLPSMLEDLTAEIWAEIGRFDVVNMSMFLEHVLDPVEAVKVVVQALAPGGVISIECPNDFNPLQLVAAESADLPMWWINRLHINYFNFESLEGLCRRAGLRPAARSTQFPLETFLLFGDVYVDDSAVGSEIHKKRMRFEETLCDHGRSELLADLYGSLAGLSLGRQAIVYALNQG